MSKPELTKELFAVTLKKLTAKKTLDKISISDISEAAGLNRQTFYYHFKDKQELVCWIFDQDVSKLTDTANNNTLIDDIARYLYSEKDFYVTALTSESQNSLREHVYQYFYDSIITDISAPMQEKKLDERTQKVFGRLFSHGIVGILVQWAQEGMKEGIVEFNEQYAPMISECLLMAMDRFSK